MNVGELSTAPLPTLSEHVTDIVNMKMRNVQLDEGWMIVRHDQPVSGEKQQLVDLWEMREISDCLKDGRQFLADLVDSLENRALRVCPMLHELSNSVDLAQIVGMLCGRRRTHRLYLTLGESAFASVGEEAWWKVWKKVSSLPHLQTLLSEEDCIPSFEDLKAAFRWLVWDAQPEAAQLRSMVFVPGKTRSFLWVPLLSSRRRRWRQMSQMICLIIAPISSKMMIRHILSFWMRRP